MASYLTAIKYTTGLLINNLKNPNISGMNLSKSRACLRQHPEKKHFKTIKYKSYPLKKLIVLQSQIMWNQCIQRNENISEQCDNWYIRNVMRDSKCLWSNGLKCKRCHIVNL